MRARGFTLIEVLIVVALIGILSGVGIALTRDMVMRYRVESEIKELYGDLMYARMHAMHTNKTYFVDLATNAYVMYADTNPAPFGDNQLQTGGDHKISEKSSLKKALDWSGGGTVSFNARGLASTGTTICVKSSVNPSCDCVKVSPTRIILGKIKSQSGSCNDANCTPQ